MPDVGGLSNLIKDIPQDEGFAGNRGALLALCVLIWGALRRCWRQAAGNARLAACAPQSWATFRFPSFSKLARLSRAIVRQVSGPNSEPLLIKSSGSLPIIEPPAPCMWLQ